MFTRQTDNTREINQLDRTSATLQLSFGLRQELKPKSIVFRLYLFIVDFKWAAIPWTEANSYKNSHSYVECFSAFFVYLV